MNNKSGGTWKVDYQIKITKIGRKFQSALIKMFNPRRINIIPVTKFWAFHSVSAIYILYKVQWSQEIQLSNTTSLEWCDPKKSNDLWAKPLGTGCDKISTCLPWHNFKAGVDRRTGRRHAVSGTRQSAHTGPGGRFEWIQNSWLWKNDKRRLFDKI